MKTMRRSVLFLALLTAWVVTMAVAVTRMLYLNPESLAAAMKSFGISIVVLANRFLEVDGEKGKDIELLYLFGVSLVAVLVITKMMLGIFKVGYSASD